MKFLCLICADRQMEHMDEAEAERRFKPALDALTLLRAIASSTWFLKVGLSVWPGSSGCGAVYLAQPSSCSG